MDYEKLADKTQIDRAIAGLKERRVDAEYLTTGAEALARIKELIPTGSSIMNGASITLEQIGFVDYLKSGQHAWKNLHEAILAEKDPAKQAQMRKQSVLSDYYLGSVHALAESGEFIVASNSGSQLPHIVYTSPHLLFVVGAQKIVPDLAAAFKRLEDYVVGRENERMLERYKAHTQESKVVIWKNESSFSTRTTQMLIVGEHLGF